MVFIPSTACHLDSWLTDTDEKQTEKLISVTKVLLSQKLQDNVPSSHLSGSFPFQAMCTNIFFFGFCMPNYS